MQIDVFVFNMLYRFVKAFLPRSKHLLISWLQTLSTVWRVQENKFLESKKINSVTVSIVSPSIRHEVIGPDAQAETTLNPFTIKESRNNEAKYSTLDVGYWFILMLLFTSIKIHPQQISRSHSKV